MKLVLQAGMEMTSLVTHSSWALIVHIQNTPKIVRNMDTMVPSAFCRGLFCPDVSLRPVFRSSVE